MRNTFRRPISPTESLYFPMRDLAPPFLMHLAVSGTGTIDADHLQGAVAAVAAVCPGTRLVRDGDDWVDSGIPPTVREIAGHAITGARLEEDPVLGSPIGPTPETTCEVLLLTADPVTVVFRAFHGVMDGRGIADWAANVFRALQGESPLPMLDTVTDDQLVRSVTCTAKPTSLTPRFRTAVGHGRQDRGLPRHILRHRSIPAVGPGAIARIAAILAAEAGSIQRIMVPVDLRRHDLRLRSTANLALPLFLDVAPGESWVQINAAKRTGLNEKRELAHMTNAGLANTPRFIARAILRATNWLGARHGRNLASATVSHLGKFDLDALRLPGFTPTTVRVMPQHSVAMPLLFALVEAGGRTELTVSARNGRGIEVRLEGLLDRIASTLEVTLPHRDSSPV